MKTVAFQMDPMERISFSGDSTVMLIAEAARRDYQIYHYTPADLSLDGDGLRAAARNLALQFGNTPPFSLGPVTTLRLDAVDVIWLRQDPPFDLSYITATHLLEHAAPALVVNDPAGVRNAPEKLLVMQFPKLMPPTLISRDVAEITAFRAAHKDIIIKPLYGNGGAGVFLLRDGDANLSVILEMFASISHEPVMVQRYLPAVTEGDKRIILVEGEPVGAILRIPKQGEARANMHVGGRAVAAEITDNDRVICAAIGPKLREMGLLFAGIDVIGNYLTEINVTSPTGIQEINRFHGVALERLIWDAVERKLAAPR